MTATAARPVPAQATTSASRTAAERNAETEDAALWAIGRVVIAPVVAAAHLLSWLARQPHVLAGLAGTIAVGLALAEGLPTRGEVLRHLLSMAGTALAAQAWTTARDRRRRRRAEEQRRADRAARRRQSRHLRASEVRDITVAGPPPGAVAAGGLAVTALLVALACLAVAL